MITVRKDPFMDIWESFFYGPSFNEKNNKLSNVINNEDDYRFQLAVPGLSKEDVKISVKDGMVYMSYENAKTDNKTYAFTKSFKKEYILPDDVDEKNITGKIENGILEVIFPKSKKKTLERLIPIG